MEKVVIIGGGIAGLSVAFDLSLRGFECILLEKDRVGSGTTTKCAGMLHSGARYIVSNPDIARVCYEESEVFKKIFPFAVGKSTGIFVILDDSDPDYIDKFEKGYKKAGMKFSRLSRSACMNLVPRISEKINGGFRTSDAVVNPHIVVAAYKDQLKNMGTDVREFNTIKSGIRDGKKWKLLVNDSIDNKDYFLNADVVVNASGSWSGMVAKTLSLNLDLVFIQGTMFILKNKVCDRVVSICAPNKTGDVIIPSGEVSLAGSTWHELLSNDYIPVTTKDRKEVVKTAGQVFSSVSLKTIDGYFSGIRTHLKPGEKSSGTFSVDRNYAIIDHQERDHVPDAYTILAGKLTLGRLVAEKLADEICRKAKIKCKHLTRDYIFKKPTNYSGLTLSESNK